MKTSLLRNSNKAFAICLATLVALLIQFATPSAQAAARTWFGGSGDWQTGVQGGWDGVWANGDTGTFNGTGGTVTNKSDIAIGNVALAFSAGNYTLQSDGLTPRTITVSNDTVTLGSGVTTTIGTNVTLARSAGGNALTFSGNTTATSTLNINSGGKVANGTNSLSLIQATANVNAGGNIQWDGSLVVGNTTDGANFNVLGGTVGLGNSNANATVTLGNVNSGNSSGNLKITGGSFGFTTAGATDARHGIRVGGTSASGSGSVTATIDLEGGTTTVRKIWESTAAYSSTLNLHGGTLKALADSSDYITVDNVWIKSGGAIFDSNGKSVTVTKDLLTDVVSTGGGLTLNDSAVTKGTLTLSGALTYTGPTLVSAGKLVVPATSSATGAATVSANAALGVTASGVSQWQPAALTLANPCTLEFNNVQNPGTTNAPLRPTAAVGSVSGVTIKINSISGTVVAGNSYPLLGNQGGTTNGYTLGTQPSGVSGHLEGISGSTLVYVVDAYSDIWTGAAGINPTWWDIATTANWTGKAVNNSPAGTYTDGDAVLFDDTATPASPVTVNIQTAVAPANVVINNSTKNYSVTNSGAGGIGGSGTLTKSGSGTLTLSGSNSYSGGTYFSGNGVLALAQSSAAGSGTINFSSTQTGTANTFTLSGGINVTNAIVMDAATGRNSIFSLSGNNTLGGNITINNNAVNLVVFNNFAALNANTTYTVGAATPSSTTISAPTFANSISFRVGFGGNFGTLNSQINAPNATVDVNTIGNWVINSTGNSWARTTLLNSGIIKLGVNNALATGAQVEVSGTGYLDLNGFNQTVAGLTGTSSTGQIANHSTTSDSTLTLAGLTTNLNFIGGITDGSGGRKTSLVMNNTSGYIQTLSGTNTYTGNTTVNGGTLELALPTLFTNSTVSVASGAFLQLDFAVTNQVVGLVLNGLSQPAGVYNSNTSPSYLVGPGSLLVSPTVATNPTNIVSVVSGGSLSLSWPADHIGWRLETQTNTLSVGLNTNWSTWPGSVATNAVSVPINPVNPAVFFRLAYP